MKYATIAYFMRIKSAVVAYFQDLLIISEYLLNLKELAVYKISTQKCGQIYALICA